MKLPDNFSFSQQNLENYVNCRRLFYLQHILKQDWPALETEPVLEHEELMRLGEQFHRLVYQHGIGIPAEVLEALFDNTILDVWRQQYQTLRIESMPGTKYYERLISVPFEHYRLVAKYDLLIFTPENHAIIYDWKTSQREPQRKWLQKRMQTLVYPLVLSLRQEPPLIQPQNIEMTYWYPAYPDSSIRFEYSPELFASGQERLRSLIHEIESLDAEQFEKTDNLRLCEFCRYRSLCERGEKAGDFRTRDEEEEDAGSPFDIDFDELTARD